MTDRERLLDKVRPVSFATAYRMLSSISNAEDVVQEALLGLHQALQVGVGGSKVPALAGSLRGRGRRHSRGCSSGPAGGAAACPQAGLRAAGHQTYRHLRDIRYGQHRCASITQGGT